MLQRSANGAVNIVDSDLYERRQIQKNQSNRLDVLEQNVKQMKQKLETISKLLEVANYAVKPN